MPAVRTWGDQASKPLTMSLRDNRQVVRQRLLAQSGGKPIFNMVSLSSGADDGAFGAGLMVGWTEHGDRPEFDLVTGISTGALMAPFVFLGPAYDEPLRKIFTAYGRGDLVDTNYVSAALGGSAINDSTPMARLIDQYVDENLLSAVARERQKGRLLLIGTTNLDAQRPVLWDMGAIALSGRKNALSLFRRILLASAAVPGILPPVHFSVDADGRSFEELHVDGGTTGEIALLPADLSLDDIVPKLAIPVPRRLYVIRNGKIGAEWQAVADNSLSIARRSISTMIKAQAMNDLRRIYEFSKREHIDFKVASIPNNVSITGVEEFSREYMVALFEKGHQLARDGTLWQGPPPEIAAR
jgi:predicted acylesterase/phospholipase RssA